MARKPSPETELRTLRSQLKHTKAAFEAVVRQRDEYRARATRSEQEAAQWRERFDLLLRREQPNANKEQG